jgi:curli biogenesis system outer membrane secretion channel CsgG
MAATMADSIARSQKKTIAVVDFTDLQGNVTELGRFLAEEFSVALAGTDKGFEVVDRTHLKAILAEHKLASTGVIDPATARKLGQIVGVEALVTGTITPFGDSVRLAVKGLDTLTAKVILAAATDIPKTKAVEELLAKGIQAGPQPAATPTPAQPATQSVAPAAPTSTGAVGRGQFKNLLIEVLECKRKGEDVTCALRLTSTEQGGRATLLSSYFYDGSRAIDPDGNQHPVRPIRLGPYSGDQPSLELVADVPMRGAVSIAGVPTSVTSFSVLVLVGNFDSPDSRYSFRLEFRRVPITN